jgi:hypothetical protein
LGTFVFGSEHGVNPDAGVTLKGPTRPRLGEVEVEENGGNGRIGQKREDPQLDATRGT